MQLDGDSFSYQEYKSQAALQVASQQPGHEATLQVASQEPGHEATLQGVTTN